LVPPGWLEHPLAV